MTLEVKDTPYRYIAALIALSRVEVTAQSRLKIVDDHLLILEQFMNLSYKEESDEMICL